MAGLWGPVEVAVAGVVLIVSLALGLTAFVTLFFPAILVLAAGYLLLRAVGGGGMGGVGTATRRLLDVYSHSRGDLWSQVAGGAGGGGGRGSHWTERLVGSVQLALLREQRVERALLTALASALPSCATVSSAARGVGADPSILRLGRPLSSVRSSSSVFIMAPMPSASNETIAVQAPVLSRQGALVGYLTVRAGIERRGSPTASGSSDSGSSSSGSRAVDVGDGTSSIQPARPSMWDNLQYFLSGQAWRDVQAGRGVQAPGATRDSGSGDGGSGGASGSSGGGGGGSWQDRAGELEQEFQRMAREDAAGRGPLAGERYEFQLYSAVFAPATATGHGAGGHGGHGGVDITIELPRLLSGVIDTERTTTTTTTTTAATVDDSSSSGGAEGGSAWERRRAWRQRRADGTSSSSSSASGAGSTTTAEHEQGGRVREAEWR